MLGGRSSLAQHERLYRSEFPERPGALTHFLGQLHPDRNINVLHYRNHSAGYRRILAGIQVPPDERALLPSFLAALDYPHWHERPPAYRLLLRQWTG